MGDNNPQEMPQPPSGIVRPGIPGAGNILDPEVRGEIRQNLHPALHEAAAKARGQHGGADAAPSKAADAASAESTADRPRPYRAGPFPHGDVDLSYIAANVPAEPVKPRRAKAGRRFYFLPAEPPPAEPPPAEPPPAEPPPAAMIAASPSDPGPRPAGPKPG